MTPGENHVIIETGAGSQDTALLSRHLPVLTEPEVEGEVLP